MVRPARVIVGKQLIKGGVRVRNPSPGFQQCFELCNAPTIMFKFLALMLELEIRHRCAQQGREVSEKGKGKKKGTMKTFMKNKYNPKIRQIA
jgi:hypothetical protein